MIYFCLHEVRSAYSKIRRSFKSFEKEWIENISQEMSIIQDGTPVYGKYNIYKRQENLCETYA